MTSDPNVLATLVPCDISCIPGILVPSVNNQLLCKIINTGNLGGNLIPKGSVYGGGATPEFDVAISPNTTYTITWGANDVSATICGTSFPSTGVGTMTTFASGSCTVAQLFGNAAGTTVTANLRKSNMVSTPGGTLLADSSGNVTLTLSSWPTGTNAPTSVELWTATDNVNFTRAATVNNPTLTVSISPPAIGSFFYAKWRGVNAGGQAAFTISKLFSGQVCDWVKRVCTNGGVAPSGVTQTAMANFDLTMVNNSLASLMYNVNVIAPDSIFAAITPFYGAANGNDPWVNHGVFVNADLTVNGLQGNGTSKYLDTGVFMGNGPWGGGAGANGGMTGYCMTSTASGSAIISAANGTGGSANMLLLNTFSVLSCVLWEDQDGNGICQGGASTQGFISGNRTGANTFSLYQATSGGFNTVHTQNTTGGVPNTTQKVYAFGSNNAGTPSFANIQCSFLAMHTGLTSAQAQTFFNAVQTMRQAFGGGYL